MRLPASMKSGTVTTYSPSTSYGYMNHESHVHKGDKVIYEKDGKQLFAGNGRGVNEYLPNWELIIDLANNLGWGKEGTIKSRSAKRFDVLKKYVTEKSLTAEILQLDWPDGGVIPASLDFWLHLWKLLPPRTVMMCIGGHGRTGTCMVALMVAAGEDYYWALEKVRTDHCDRAVETLNQALYLHNLYQQMLIRELTVAEKSGDQDQIAFFEKEITYSKNFVPNSYSYYGDKEPPKAVQQPIKGFSPSSGTSLVGQGTTDPGDRIKIVGHNMYEQICVEPNCNLKDCRVGDHQGWVLFDPETLANGVIAN